MAWNRRGPLTILLLFVLLVPVRAAMAAEQTISFHRVFVPHIGHVSGGLPNTGAVVVEAGRNHTCTLTIAGNVKCWGWNINGQLGDGTSGAEEYRLTPEAVEGLVNNVRAIAVGQAHTCALTDAGGVKCWGWNQHGQLGDGSSGEEADKPTPVDVVGMVSGVQSIAAGESHTCALTTAGRARCWGLNSSGQLGNGSTADNLTPIDVVDLGGDVHSIAAGRWHTCALMSAGDVHCWGNNYFGQLGNGMSGTGSNQPTPVEVVGLAGSVQAIALGHDHTCALTDAEEVKCWGWNAFGQLGDGTEGWDSNKNTPVDVVGLTDSVKAITAGHAHTCALTHTRGAECWGSNAHGQLGNGTGSWDSNRNTPVTVVNLWNDTRTIAAGHAHTCAITRAGGITCWGGNRHGQLGNGATTDSFTPIGVVALME